MKPVNWVGVNFWNTQCQNELKKYNGTDNSDRADCPLSPKQWSSSLEPRSGELNKLQGLQR